METEPAVEIRRETSPDHSAISDVVTRAFGSAAEARLVAAIRASPEYLPELALVAVVDDQVVGHVMISGCTVLDPAGGEATAVLLSPLAVDPDHQRSGVGARLIAEVAARAAAAGHPFVVLEGDPRYYARFGFEPAGRYGIQLPLPDWAPPDAAQVLRLIPGATVPAGRIVYPAAFSVLDAQ